MQRALLLPFLLLGCTAVGLAQRQAEHWHFGFQRHIHFINGVPTLGGLSAQFTEEGCASYSDERGQLLFYTNGGGRRPDQPGTLDPGTIWNREHQSMYDMRGQEGGGYSARQSALVVPDPSADDRYYLFTMEEREYDLDGPIVGQPLGRGLSFFTIDMQLNGGLGGVVFADERVYVPAYEGLSGTRHANGVDYWVVAHHNDSVTNALVVVPVTAAGVGEPVQLPVPTELPLQGSIKMSPDGSKLYCNGAIFDFDPAAGTVESRGIKLPPSTSLSTSFSPDSRYLYTVTTDNVATGRQLSRFDLLASDVTASRELIDLIGDGFTYQMQLGPNGNLYFLESDMRQQSLGLSEITCASTDRPVVRRNLLTLTDTSSSRSLPATGLPNFMDHIFARQLRNDTTTLEVEVFNTCPGQPIELSTRTEGVAYQWSTGDTTAVISVAAAGIYTLTVTDICGNVIIDPKEIILDPLPDIRLVRETEGAVCPTATIELIVEGGNYDSLGFVNNIIVADPSPRRILERIAYNACGTDTARLSVPLLPDTVIATIERGECAGDSLRLRLVGEDIDSVRWSTGQSDRAVWVQVVDTSYTVTVFGPCGQRELREEVREDECPKDCRVEIPNAFSPNVDGVNDVFRPFTNCDLEEYELIIINRWGQEVFRSRDPEQGWEGRKGDTPQPADVYLYRMVYQFPLVPERYEREGQVLLAR